MKSIFLAVAVLVAVALADQINSDWEQWKIINKKSYSIVEDKLRREIFSANAEKIASHNRLFDLGLKSFRLGVNRFTDMTDTERAQFLGAKPTEPLEGLGFKTHITSRRNNPDSFDWRNHNPNPISEIKDQGQCGSCWSFSTTGSVETHHALYTSTGLYRLSEQQLIDCSNVAPYNNGGCNGGWMNTSMQYIKDVGGIMREADYPYEAKDGTCRFDVTKEVATVTGFVNIRKGDEQDLQDAVVNKGPVSVAIEVANTFYSYSGGVYDGDDCHDDQSYLDHAVLVVGYGTENGDDFWIVKNSWGDRWGEYGYIRMARNRGKCGIALAACYPTVV